jgi:phosphatidate cytidylyltransferase
MAMNIQTLKTRSLTAVVFVIVMLAGLLLNGWGFITLFTIIHFGCWYEFIKLIKKIHGRNAIVYYLLGLLYITLPVLMMVQLGTAIFTGGNPHNLIQNNYSPFFPCIIIFSIWINDTMAYIVGSLIGKTPFSKISPKKTWEGTIGGALLCIIVIGLLGYYIPYVNTAIPVKHIIAIAFICAIFGTAGDLLESKFKRMADVKDSGSIMPGHGGFLDRFDSFLIATPLVWLYLFLMSSGFVY